MRERLAHGKPLLDPSACRDYAADLTAKLDERLAKETATALPPSHELAGHAFRALGRRAKRSRRCKICPELGDPRPVLVADEPDESRPDDWLIHAYFEHEPSGRRNRRRLAGSASGHRRSRSWARQDWVTMSQAGLQPIRAGRFTVHTPTYAPEPERINFEIDAGLAFGTGQHATTAGCLAALDRLETARERRSKTSPTSAPERDCSRSRR